VRKLASLGGRSGRRLMRPLFANPLGVQLGHFAGLIDGDHAPEKDIELYMDHLNQLDQEVFFQMVSEMSRHDLTDLLPTVAVPVLVFAAEKDLFTPVHRARLMAESIPFSELIVLEGASHAAIVEHPDRINQRIERFFRERVNGPKDRQN
jgi:pimeloyl-ACP methyl ester carboxylesterase